MKNTQEKLILPNAPVIIAVASGKGGVGKSTTAVNLAVALSSYNKSIGLLDADIYGPSIPKMMGLTTEPLVDSGKITPFFAYGVECLSMGSFVGAQSPLIWRGPMVQTALLQLLRDTNWGVHNPQNKLDVLLIDMPPGTGDIYLTLMQKFNLRGAIIVSTPQDIALIDASKSIAMFRRLGIPLLGLIENMSFFCCPNCGCQSDIFGNQGAKLEANRQNIPFLGEIPIQLAVRQGADQGTPFAAIQSKPTIYHAIAQHLLRAINI